MSASRICLVVALCALVMLAGQQVEAARELRGAAWDRDTVECKTFGELPDVCCPGLQMETG